MGQAGNPWGRFPSDSSFATGGWGNPFFQSPAQGEPRREAEEIDVNDLVDLPVTSEDTPGWQNFFNQEQFSDVTLIASDGVPFFCHCVILARWSAPLAAMLGGGMSESRCRSVTLHNADEAVVRALLSFCYGIPSQLELHRVVQLAALADQYDITALLRCCVNALTSSAGRHMGFCCRTYMQAKQYGIPDLERRCWMLMRRNLGGLERHVEEVGELEFEDIRRLCWCGVLAEVAPAASLEPTLEQQQHSLVESIREAAAATAAAPGPAMSTSEQQHQQSQPIHNIPTHSSLLKLIPTTPLSGISTSGDQQQQSQQQHSGAGVMHEGLLGKCMATSEGFDGAGDRSLRHLSGFLPVNNAERTADCYAAFQVAMLWASCAAARVEHLDDLLRGIDFDRLTLPQLQGVRTHAVASRSSLLPKLLAQTYRGRQ